MTWKSRGAYGFLVVAAIFAAFSAGYRMRAQAGENDRWLPPSASLAPLVRTADGKLVADLTGGDGPSRPRKSPPDLSPYETFHEVRQAIKENFVHTKVDDTELTYGAVRGMLRSLGDRFTRFLTPKDYDKFLQNNGAEIIGIGVRIGLKDEYNGSKDAKPMGASRPFVVEPLPEGPALKAGLQKEDVILEIDGHSTADMNEDAAITYIQGLRGTPVKLKLERKIPSKAPKGEPTFKTFEVNLVRDVIPIHPVTLEWLPDNIAWLRLDEFNKKSEPEVAQALRNLRKAPNGQPAKGLILDMRNNPGGLLDSAVEIGSHFIPTGPIVYTRERTGAERSLNAERDRFMNLKMPIIVLINNYSASAAEIVTGALKDKGIATVVGEHSYGKASVQVLVELRNGGALVITTAKYLTPNKHDISDKGIAPDVIVKSNAADDEPGNGRGAQLQKAVTLIKEKNAAPTTSVAVRSQ